MQEPHLTDALKTIEQKNDLLQQKHRNATRLDMAHFMFYAGKAYEYKMDKKAAQDMLDGKPNSHKIYAENFGQVIAMSKINPVAEAVQDGYKQEMSDRFAANILLIVMKIYLVINLVQILVQIILILIVNYH